MDAGAIIMLIFGGTALWGGLIVAIINYNRASRREKAE